MTGKNRELAASIAGLTLEEFDRPMALHAKRERVIAAVTDEQIKEAFGFVPEGEELEFMRRDMRIHVAGLPHDSRRCPDCGGTGDSFRSPAGIIRCQTCGGQGWVRGW